MIGKVAVGILILFLFFTIGTTPILSGVHDWRTQEITQSAVVTTGGGITTKDIVLTKDLYGGLTGEISSITSNITETPVATTYVSATNTLTISALAESQTRALTIIYSAESDDAIMRGIGAFITPLIFMFVIGVVVWGVFGTGGRRR